MAEATKQEWSDAEEERFKFLDELRESGATNMFGATPFIQDAFGLTKGEARHTLTEWMRTFEQRHPEGGA